MLHEAGVILQLMYGLLELELEKKNVYMCEDKWMFFIKENKICLKGNFVINKNKVF